MYRRGSVRAGLLVVRQCAAQHQCPSKTEVGRVGYPHHSQGPRGRRTIVNSTFQMGHTLTPPPPQVAPSGPGGTTQFGHRHSAHTRSPEVSVGVPWSAQSPPHDLKDRTLNKSWLPPSQGVAAQSLWQPLA